jgi:hypothetical protein
VQIEQVKGIPRTERGKFRSVICQIPPEHRVRPTNLVTTEPISR